MVYSKGNRKPLEGLRCCHLIAMAIPGNQCCLCCCWTVAPLHHWVPKSIFPTSGESKCDWQCWDHTPAWAWALGWGEGKKTDAASLHRGRALPPVGTHEMGNSPKHGRMGFLYTWKGYMWSPFTCNTKTVLQNECSTEHTLGNAVWDSFHKNWCEVRHVLKTLSHPDLTTLYS